MHTPETFVHTLRALPALANVFNPWRDCDPALDAHARAPHVRGENLRRYLAMRAQRTKLLFVGEAPGYQGCRFSGIAMTSERILLGNKPGIASEAVFAGEKHRTSRASLFARGANEPTASIVWSRLLGMGLEPHEFAFWNAFACHPHRAGEPLSNRAPSRAEVAALAHVLPQMIALIRPRQVVAVGNVARALLAALGVPAHCVRHSAMGGAARFREQVLALGASGTQASR